MSIAQRDKDVKQLLLGQPVLSTLLPPFGLPLMSREIVCVWVF